MVGAGVPGAAEGAADLGLGGRVVFTGRSPDRAQFMALADVHANIPPSRHHARHRADQTYEYMASGRPVLARSCRA